MEFNWKSIIDTVFSWLTDTALKVVIAVIILIILFKIINRIFKRLEKRLENNEKLDKTVKKAILYAGKVGAECLVAAALVGYVGIDTSGISALIASLGVCVGLAVNGALSNLAGGVLLLLTRPFKADDFIEAAGFSGTVEEIHIISTRLRTADNKVVYIPNGTLSSSSIVNYTEKGTRRLDLVFSISYNNDFERAKQLIRELCEAHELIMKDPAPNIRMSAHGESSIDISAMVWVNAGDYWTVRFDLLESVKRKFDENGIEIPYKQVDVHMINE